MVAKEAVHPQTVLLYGDITFNLPSGTKCISVRYTYNKLSVSFKKFSRRHPMLFNKYAVSVKRHIREGICIPLDVKPDLVRNISLLGIVVVVNVHSVQIVVAVVCSDDLGAWYASVLLFAMCS